MDKPIQLKISEIVEDNPQVKTFYFNYPLNSKPGQFVMLWVVGTDQKPFSIAYDDGQKFGLTIFKRGPATNKLFEMKVGERVGITGPFGTNFSVKQDTHYIMIAGGYGAAPLGFLSEQVSTKENVKIDFCMGARSKDLLLFEDRINKIPNTTMHISTDDGSVGHKGFVTDNLVNLLKNRDPSTPVANAPSARDDNQLTLVVTCGPELMEKKVLDICNEHNVECEVSIERYMKCGYGICGQCVVDPLGICMCTHGPVVKRELANQITEFGKYHRSKSGKIVEF